MVSQEARKVFTLVLVWGSMGLYLEITGPTMIDIRLIFNATYEDVSHSVSGRGAGGFIGALIGGCLVDNFSHSLDLFIALSETVAGMAIMSLPYTHSINTLWFHYLTLGVCSGVIGIAGIRSVIMLWPEKTAVCLHLLHVGYGVGALLVPLFVNPFLAVVTVIKQKTGNQTKETFKIIENTNVQHAFTGIGIWTLVLSVIYFRHYCNRHSSKGYKRLRADTSKTKTLTFKQMINPATYANGQLGYGIFVLIVLFIYFFTLVGGIEMFAHFVRSFSVEVFKFTKTKASYLNMTFWLGLTIGRLIGSLLSSFVPIRKLFMAQVLLHLCSAAILNIYASTSSEMLWYCTAMEGFTISPLYPSGIAYGNTLIEITGMCLMVMSFAGSVGDLSFIWIAGNLYDSFGPKYILYGLQLVGIVICVCAILFKIVERYKRPKELEIVVQNF